MRQGPFEPSDVHYERMRKEDEANTKETKWFAIFVMSVIFIVMIATIMIWYYTSK